MRLPVLAVPILAALAASTAAQGVARATVSVVSIDHEPISGDVFHTTTVLRVGDAPHALLTIHRVVREHSGVPRHAPHAVILLHGDFATFTSNFLPSSISPATGPANDLAVHLANQGIDVWGMDRRWTTAPPDETDFSDFGAMTLAAAIDDVETAIVYARLTRGLTGSGFGRIALGGFSSGAFLAYQVAAAETALPWWLTQVDALMPIDVYAHIAPEDEELRLAACARRDEEQFFIDLGFPYGENGFFALIGELARLDPDGISPINPARTNRSVLLNNAGRTWLFFGAAPFYHLAGTDLVGNQATAFLWSPELRIADWFAAAPFYQSMAESLDMDAFQCNEAPLSVEDRIADIDVPLLYVAAAGGYGAYGLYTTGLVQSDDVQTILVQRLDDEAVAEDFGHGDLLYGTDAPTLAWDAMADWLLDH